MSQKPVNAPRLSPSMALVPSGESWEGKTIDEDAHCFRVCSDKRHVVRWLLCLLSFNSDLRRESRRLENEIDSKLVSFGKLSSSYHHRESG